MHPKDTYPLTYWKREPVSWHWICTANIGGHTKKYQQSNYIAFHFTLVQKTLEFIKY